jgi:DNA-directed RNA polymerase subunit F
MKKEYLKQFEELDEELLSELIDDLTKIWYNKTHKEEITKEDEKIAMYYEKDKKESLDSLNNI